MYCCLCHFVVSYLFYRLLGDRTSVPIMVSEDGESPEVDAVSLILLFLGLLYIICFIKL